MATLRDSAGNEVFVQNGLTWDLRDTAGVLQAFVSGPHVFFFARGPGRATLIARYEALTDTGVVVVTPDTAPPPPPPPPPVHVASLTVTPDSQERAVGDSGWVIATLRDSAGAEVFAPLTWDVEETTAGEDTTGPSVLSYDRQGTRGERIRFVALGPGRVRFIARHEALADTGVVVVR